MREAPVRISAETVGYNSKGFYGFTRYLKANYGMNVCFQISSY
jgi:hypothetical protein